MKPNPVVWFEIYVQDMARARRFYEGVLECKLETLPAPPGDASELEMLSFPMDMTTPGAAGALVRMAGVPSGGGGTMVYFACDDCSVEAGRAANFGGSIKQPKFAIGQYGHCAMIIDTEGNCVGLHSMK